jgi:hypothetical protein
MLGEIIWNEDTIGIVSTMAVPVAIVFIACWMHVERRKSDNALKRRMVERGMSAEEIERVIAAKGSK